MRTVPIGCARRKRTLGCGQEAAAEVRAAGMRKGGGRVQHALQKVACIDKMYGLAHASSPRCRMKRPQENGAPAVHWRQTWAAAC